MDYLIYIAHDAENLQFYLWLQDYTARFEALPEDEKALSPEWVLDEVPSGPRAESPGPGMALPDGFARTIIRPMEKALPAPPRFGQDDKLATIRANNQTGMKWESCTSLYMPS